MESDSITFPASGKQVHEADCHPIQLFWKSMEPDTNSTYLSRTARVLSPCSPAGEKVRMRGNPKKRFDPFNLDPFAAYRDFASGVWKSLIWPNLFQLGELEIFGHFFKREFSFGCNRPVFKFCVI